MIGCVSGYVVVTLSSICFNNTDAELSRAALSGMLTFSIHIRINSASMAPTHTKHKQTITNHKPQTTNHKPQTTKHQTTTTNITNTTHKHANTKQTNTQHQQTKTKHSTTYKKRPV